jgi:hypothetical protein
LLRLDQAWSTHAFYAYIKETAMARIRNLQRRTRRSHLSPRDLLLLDNAQRTIIAVERGCVWVTLESDPRDIILSEGMRFEIDRPGRTIVAAEVASSLRLLSPVSRRERLARALARAVAPLAAAWSGRVVRRALPHA